MQSVVIYSVFLLSLIIFLCHECKIAYGAWEQIFNISAKVWDTEFKKGKSNPHKVEEARKNANILMNELTEYNQRCDLGNKKEKSEEKK